jgi:hypothetical protein
LNPPRDPSILLLPRLIAITIADHLSHDRATGLSSGPCLSRSGAVGLKSSSQVPRQLNPGSPCQKVSRWFPDNNNPSRPRPRPRPRKSSILANSASCRVVAGYLGEQQGELFVSPRTDCLWKLFATSYLSDIWVLVLHHPCWQAGIPSCFTSTKLAPSTVKISIFSVHQSRIRDAEPLGLITNRSRLPGPPRLNGSTRITAWVATPNTSFTNREILLKWKNFLQRTVKHLEIQPPKLRGQISLS